MRERNYYYDSSVPRSCDNIGCDVTLLYAHWSIINSNVEEVNKQPERLKAWYILATGNIPRLYLNNPHDSLTTLKHAVQEL